MLPIEAVKNGLGYLRQNPTFLLQAARDAARLRIAVPLDALRWLIEKLPKRGKGPQELEVFATPPALGVGATVDLFGTKLRVSASVSIDQVRAGSEEVRIELRVADLQIQAPPGSPAAQMIGAMDLKRPGNLMGFMPKKPPALVEAKDDRFVLDLLRVPSLGANKVLRKALGVVADVVSIKEIRTQGDVLVIGLGVHPLALPGALRRLQAAS